MSLEYLFFFMTIVFAGFTQGLSGFGSLLVSMPILAVFMDIKLLIPLLCLLGLCINVPLFYKLREHADYSIILPLVLASLPGIPVGIYVLKTVSPHILKLILGVMLTLFSLYLLSGRRPHKGPAPWWKWPAGFVSGCLGGSIGATGPPIIAYVTLQTWPKDVMKAAMVSFFFITGIGICAMQAATGLVTTRVLADFVSGVPALILGVFLGHKCYGRVSEQVYRKIITIMLLLLGIFMIVQGFGFPPKN